MVKLMAFLGNPTSQYAKTRHNVGWMIADHIYPMEAWSQKFHGRMSSRDGVFLLKPETFMNESGRSVRAALDYYNLEAEQLLVIHDDLELPFGTLRLQQGGGLGGHKGLRSIVQHLSDDSFLRLRVGVGRPVHGSVSSWVLSRFDPIEEALLPDLFNTAHIMLKSQHSTLPVIKTFA
ncbi:MAG TPA: aminoacyl-tRNA hydrolase [Sphaerochaeta sp.]|nr:aminoacyl-tRNA hydrolase [Sphaerochaeta sp.]HPZ16536.1 aminoacyl-tRNA hydrolase [Sphaerochaeta sp.]